MREKDSKRSKQTKTQLYLDRYQGDLKTFGLQNLQNLSAEQKQKIAFQLLRGLAKMHELGICHNNIKLENILIRLNEGEVEVVFCDFDLAFSDEDAPIFGGSPLWASPEICAIAKNPETKARLSEVSKPKDVWSLGLVFRILFVPQGEPDWFKFSRKIMVFDHLVNLAEAGNQEGSFYAEPNEKGSLEHIIWEMLQFHPENRLTAQQALDKAEALFSK